MQTATDMQPEFKGHNIGCSAQANIKRKTESHTGHYAKVLQK